MSATLKAPPNLQFLAPRPALVHRIKQAVRGAYERHGAARAKAIARDASADSRTAESWIYDDAVAPRSPELVRMMAANNQLEAEIIALVREIREQTKCPREPSSSASAPAGPAMTVDRRAPSALAC